MESRPRTGLKWLIVCGLLLASFGLILLAVRPDLDLAASDLFFAKGGGFIGLSPQAHAFRGLAEILPFLVYAAAVLLYVGGFLRALPARLTPSHRGMVFLTLTLALGPGLLVNVVLKPHFHRPRPAHVQTFGGAAPFRAFYRADGDCAKNCSFPSGETAAAFWLMAPASLAPPPLRAIALAGALLFGLATGGFRMAAGAHFLSDVLASGLQMGLLILGLWIVTRPRRAPERAKAQTVTEAGLREDLASL